MTFYQPGEYDHSVLYTTAQLTEGRSARDQPKQPPAKKIEAGEVTGEGLIGGMWEYMSGERIYKLRRTSRQYATGWSHLRSPLLRNGRKGNANDHKGEEYIYIYIYFFFGAVV